MPKLVHRMLLLAACLLIGGCTHVHTTRSSDERQIRQLNEQGQKSTARVTLRGGTRFRAENVRAAADSVSWMYLQTGERGHASFSEIETIEFASRTRGALEGAGLGVPIGAAVGAAVGLIALTVTDTGTLFSPVSDVLLTAIWGSGAGTFVGVWAGLDKGSVDVYRPAPAEEARSP